MRIDNFDNFIQKGKIGISLFEDFNSQWDPERWPKEWKEMPEWKTLQELGFTDNTSQFSKNSLRTSIWLKNERFPLGYPSGIVLQASGYIRNKDAKSGFVKKDLNLKQMFDYLIERWSKEVPRYVRNPKHGDLRDEIIGFVNNCTRSQWSFNPKTRMIDVKGSVLVLNSPLLEEIKFGNVGGNFVIGSSGISDIRFSPESVGGDFSCKGNLITSLEGLPQKFKSNESSISIGNNQIESLVGIPESFTGTILAPMNKLKNLMGCPKVLSFLDVTQNDLKSLEGIGDKIDRILVDEYMIDGWSYERGIEIILGKYLPKKLEWQKEYDLRNIKKLLLPLYDAEKIALYFKNNILDLHFLDDYPDLKKRVIDILGIRDISKISKLISTGLL